MIKIYIPEVGKRNAGLWVFHLLCSKQNIQLELVASRHVAAGLKGEYTVQSPAELKVNREFYLTSVAESSTLHSPFECRDARSTFGISHSRISRQMRRRHTRTRREHPILAMNNVASYTVISKCTLRCVRAIFVSPYQSNSEIAARKYPLDISTV